MSEATPETQTVEVPADILIESYRNLVREQADAFAQLRAYATHLEQQLIKLLPEQEASDNTEE